MPECKWVVTCLTLAMGAVHHMPHLLVLGDMALNGRKESVLLVEELFKTPRSLFPRVVQFGLFRNKVCISSAKFAEL